MPILSSLMIASGIAHPESGGPATYLHELLPALQTRGWSVTMIAYGDPRPDDPERYPYPLTRIPRRALPRRVAAYARGAGRLLKSADLVYVHSLDLPLIGARAPRLVKIVGDQAWERAIRKGWIAPDTDIDRFQTMRYSPLVALTQGVRAAQVRAFDGVITPSAYLRQMVIGWGVAPERVTVVYNALPAADPAVIAAQGMTQAEARAALGLPIAAPIVLTVGRLVPWKGIDHLIAARDAVPALLLLVAGDGDDRPRLEALAGAGVRFLGQVARTAMPLLMRAADYLALYSGYEGLSHTLLEALRVGTPVIASDRGGNPEVVGDGVNGLLVPHVDRDALRAALTVAFTPGMRDRLAANSGIGMERFDFTHMVDETDRVLRQALN